MDMQGQSSFLGRGQAYGGRQQRGGMMGGRQPYGQAPMGGMGGGQMNGRMGWQGGGNMPGPFMPGMGGPGMGMGMGGMGMGGPMGPPMPFMPPGMGMQGVFHAGRPLVALLLAVLRVSCSAHEGTSCRETPQYLSGICAGMPYRPNGMMDGPYGGRGFKRTRY